MVDKMDQTSDSTNTIFNNKYVENDTTLSFGINHSKDKCDWNDGVVGIDETEFKTNREESAKLFARNLEDSAFGFQDLLDTLSSRKVMKKNAVSHVELDSLTNRLLLKLDRSNIRSKYGYDLENNPFLYPEEALYLLEIGKVEIFSGHVSLSVQRARSLLLVSQRSEGQSRLWNCTTEEYLVYKYLTRMGYSLYRYARKSQPSPTSTFNDLENEIMEDSDVMIESETEVIGSNNCDISDVESSKSNCNHRKCLKRKLSAALSDGQASKDAGSDNVMESLDINESSIFCKGEGKDLLVKVEPGGYTVDEADSDVEFVDEVIHHHPGVEIQEIDHCIGFKNDDFVDEPTPSTSKGPSVTQVLVDLVSSDDEDSQDVKFYSNKIWSKFVPNSKIIFEIPPSGLIPQVIPESENFYEFDLKDKSDVSDLELEFLVDEVSLNDDIIEMSSSNSKQIYASTTKSWKEWRQSVFKEARDAMNDSLIASSDYINGETAGNRLFLWKDSDTKSQPQLPCENNIVFQMYGPVGQGFSRMRAFEGKPSYYTVITRFDEPIQDFSVIESDVDGVPILIAVVCDSGENDVAFMTTDRSPLNSLF